MAEHIITPKTYLLVFAALMVLTGLTVWMAFIDWGGAEYGYCAGHCHDQGSARRPHFYACAL